MSNEEFLIKGAGLQKTFNDFWGRPKVKAIQNIDITVPKGSIFGLLGPNGAGKSTLLKIILGHLYPTAGRIQVLGKDPRDVSIKQKMGYLPERSYLYKNLTATETLHYFGEILGLDKKQIKTRTEQLLEMVGLKNALHRQVGQFSHGMTRRMGLAQALLNDPELLILDEPTAGLDPVGCREVKDLILTLGQRGKTVVLTSHLLADVEDVADDLLMIFGGTVQSSGQAKSLLQDQDKTRLEFPNVSKATLQKALSSLKSELPSSSINITSPNQSLEDYFLNIVRTSTAKGDSTSGASAGSGVAEYLKDENEETEKIDLANNSELNIQNSKLSEKPKQSVSQAKRNLSEAKPKPKTRPTEQKPGNPDGSSTTSSDSSAGSAEFHSEPNSNLNSKESHPQIPPNITDKENSANCQLPTEDSSKSNSELNIPNSKLSEDPKQSASKAERNLSETKPEPQVTLPPVPKLSLSENEQVSIKMKKINKFIHRA